MLNNKICHLIILITLCFFTHNLIGQEKELCKSWKIDYYIVNGKKKLPNIEEKKNIMTFSENGSFKGIEDSFSLNGKWKLDIKKNKIYIIIDDFPEKLILKIIKLDDSSFSWEAKNIDDGTLRKTYMIPIK